MLNYSHWPRFDLAAAALLAMSSACASRAGTLAPRPHAPTYAEAAEFECVRSAAATPFVIDLPPDERGQVELALRQDLAVVFYDCKRLELLPNCSVAGDYSYAGHTRREQVMRLRSKDEARANLSFSAAGGPGRIGIELDRGATLDVALAMVGRKSASMRQVLRDDLVGDCTRATHYVSAATLGAFTMITDTSGRAQSAAEIFGAGASGSSAETMRVMNQDGTLEACRTAQPSAEGEAPGCSAPLRLRLQPFVEGAQPPGAGDVLAATPEGEAPGSCPNPYVSADSGQCVPPTKPHFCNVEDMADCEAQCKAGSMASCAVLGRSYQMGWGVKKDPERALSLLKQACLGGVSPACGRIGELLLASEDTMGDGIRLLEKACSDGWARGCTILGTHWVKRTKAHGSVNVFDLFERSCRTGDAEGCWSLGTLFNEGLGVAKNPGEAMRYFERSCQGGALLGCSTYGQALAEGFAGTPDPQAAAKVLERACKLGYSASCNQLSMQYLLGQGVARNVERGIQLLDRACLGTDYGSCLVLGMRYRTGTGVALDENKGEAYLTRACEHGIEQACQALEP